MRKIFCIAFILLAMGLFAHDVSLTIRDADLDMPLEGAKVRTHTGAILEADADGLVRFAAPDDRAIVVIVDYPGYQQRKIACKPVDSFIPVDMSLSGISESRELVVEGKRQDKTDAKVGESVVMKKETIRETAKMGLVEDVMTSIKTLPGVGFTGGWNAMPSIRGGDPSDLVACLDGFYVDSPYHWGGAYSIFNPNMVESAKLSHGIFSVRHGNASSGLLEVTSIEPDPDNVRTDLAVTTSAVELGSSLPLAGKGGVFVGGKVTYWDPFIYIAGKIKPSVSDTIAQAPYIRDAYLKADYRIDDGCQVYANGFFGSDGIGIHYTENGSSDFDKFSYDGRFDYSNQVGFFSGGLKLMPEKNLLVNVSLGVGFDSTKLDLSENASGTRNYGSQFTALYGGLLGGATSYNLIDRDNAGTIGKRNTSVQGRVDADWEIAPWLAAGFGANEIARASHNNQKYNGWNVVLGDYDETTGAGFATMARNLQNVSNDGSKTYSTGGYAFFNAHTPDKRMSAELGARVDHFYYALGDYRLNTMPAVNPRMNVSYDAIRNEGIFDHVTLTAGSGLFSHITPYQNLIDKSSGLGNFDLKPDRSWNSVTGVEVQLGDSYKFSLEGYYKHVFDRAYANVKENDPNQTIAWHFDGQAEIWGFDILLQKLQSRYVDGWITYSFNYARYRNPVLDPGTTDTSGGPLSTDWYYPSFHRFHTANLVLDWKPASGFDVLTKVAVASGKPLEELSGKRCYALLQSDGTYAEYWTRKISYSDSKRMQLSCPVDLKLTWTNYGKGKKTKTQWYVAAEDIFTNLYHPKGNTTISQYTGEEVPDSGSADFSIGFPMVSIGMSWSY